MKAIGFSGTEMEEKYNLHCIIYNKYRKDKGDVFHLYKVYCYR